LRLAGVDLSAAMLAVARTKLPDDVCLLRAAADVLPLAPASYDVVTLTSALHHLPRPAAALAEIRRVLKPAGCLVLTDWCGDFFFYPLLAAWLRLTRRPIERIFRSDECCALLGKAGFRIMSVDRFSVNWQWRLMTIVAERD
jgi:ubiquinone/menaquinone biosynthesis C-methylase UbiE